MISTEGVICVLKPPGMSSSDAVTDIRRVFGEKRVGHTGTLDPAAAGVLPVCVGRATRLFDFLVDKEKEYVAEIVFGKATDTEDSMGYVLEESDRIVTADDLIAVFPQFLGRISQTPPIYSALNVNGVKLYKLARKGEITEAIADKKREIEIRGLSLVRQTGENRFLLRIVCSKGTYIRTLCKDIGSAVGCPAYMGFLLRTCSGRFRLEDSYSIAELNDMRDNGNLSEAVIPMDEAVSHLQTVNTEHLSDKEKKLLIHGAPVRAKGPERVPLRVYSGEEFLGIGEIVEGELRITVWLGDVKHQIKGFKVEGVVAAHNHVGTRIGFPTANLSGFRKNDIPPEGVYATVAEFEGTSRAAVTSIGFNPTFGGDELTVETHIIGFSGNLYGKRVTLRFVSRLRGMIRFSSAEELAAQIAEDVKRAQEIVENSKYTE